MERGHRQSPDARTARAPSTADGRSDAAILLRAQRMGCDESPLHLELREWRVSYLLNSVCAHACTWGRCLPPPPPPILVESFPG